MVMILMAEETIRSRIAPPTTGSGKMANPSSGGRLEVRTVEARSTGADVEAVIAKVLDSRIYALQAFKICLGILNLQRNYGAEKLNKACRRALSFGTYSYTRIKNILAQGLEQERQPQLDLRTAYLPEHENLRGSGYFN